VPLVVPIVIVSCSKRGWPRCVFSVRSSQRHIAGIVENYRTCRVGCQLRCHATLVLFRRDIVSVVVGGYQLSAEWIGISPCLCVSGVRSRASRRQRRSCSISDLDRSVASPIRPRVWYRVPLTALGSNQGRTECDIKGFILLQNCHALYLNGTGQQERQVPKPANI